MKNTLQQGNVLSVADRKATDTDEITYLRRELQNTEAELKQARTEIQTLESILQLVDGVFYAFQSFGLSLHETQNTYTKLTWMLDQERSSAIEATNEASVANHLFTGLTDKLLMVADTVSQSINKVDAIAEHVTQEENPAVAMKMIRDETAASKQLFDDMQQQMQILTSTGSFAGDGLTRLKELSFKLEETVTIGAFRGFIELTKLDHLVFKFNIYRAFMGHTEMCVSDITDHHHCRLGQWYYEGEGASECSALSGFDALEAPHARLHNYGIAAIDAFNRDDIPAAIKSLKNMEAASLEFQQHLELLADSGENDRVLLCAGNH